MNLKIGLLTILLITNSLALSAECITFKGMSGQTTSAREDYTFYEDGFSSIEFLNFGTPQGNDSFSSVNSLDGMKVKCIRMTDDYVLYCPRDNTEGGTGISYIFYEWDKKENVVIHTRIVTGSTDGWVDKAMLLVNKNPKPCF